MKNENCLKGMMCPRCGHTDDFIIGASIMVRATDDGAEQARHSDTEWDDDSYCECGSCPAFGKVKDFTIPGFRVTFEIYSDLGLEMGEPDRRGWWMPGEWLFDKCPDELAFEFDPELAYDEEEHEDLDDAIVEWALRILRHNGAVHPSCDPSDHAQWWTTGGETHDIEKGTEIGKSFHFENFRDDLVERINRRMAS